MLLHLSHRGIEHLRGHSEAHLAVRAEGVIRPRLGQSLPVGVGTRAPIDAVEIGIGEPSQKLGALETRPRKGDDFFKDIAGAGRVRRQDPVLGLCRTPSAAGAVVESLRRRKVARSRAQLRRRNGSRPARAGAFLVRPSRGRGRPLRQGGARPRSRDGARAPPGPRRVPPQAGVKLASFLG